MNATSMFWPSASSPMSVDAPSAMTSLGVDLVAALDDRALVDVGVLVRALVLDQVVDVDADFARHRFLVVDADHDAVGVDVVDHAAALGGDDRARVHRRRRARRRCRRTAFSGRSTARPGAACSRPSARGSRRRARGTAPARRPPTRSASAPRPCTGSRSAEVSIDSPLSRAETSSSISLPSASSVAFAWAITYLPSSIADR